MGNKSVTRIKSMGAAWIGGRATGGRATVSAGMVGMAGAAFSSLVDGVKKSWSLGCCTSGLAFFAISRGYPWTSSKNLTSDRTSTHALRG